MYHAMSSDDDDDLPTIASLCSWNIPTFTAPKESAPIVLSDDDEEYTMSLSDRLKIKTTNQNKVSKLKDFYSSESDSDCMALPDPTSLIKPTGTGLATTTSQQSASSYTNVQIYPSGNLSPANKRKKRTADQISESKRQAELKKLEKQEEKDKKRIEREDKARAKETEMAKKRFVREKKRAATPAECLKYVTLMLDPELVKQPCGARIIAMAAERELRYEIIAQPHSNLICFWREVSVAIDKPGQQFEVVKKEVVEDQLLLWLPVMEFVQYVSSQRQQLQGQVLFGQCPTLRAFIQSLQKKLEDRNITLIVQGLQQYYKEQTRKRGNKHQAEFVSRLDVEETLVDIQFTTRCNIRFTEADDETAKLIWHYTKAVASTPYKKGRNDCDMNIHIDTTTCVKLEADGTGVARAWRQIIQIFRGISAEVANAIMAEYPTPRALYEAYQKCSTEKEAVQVLENIMVRRGYGVLETNRRVGKELGKKLHILLTTRDPQQTLK